MKSQINVTDNSRLKAVIINVLFATTIIIMLLGVFFSVYCIVNNISFKVLNSSVHGAIFGIMVSYLGLRYYFSVTKLKGELFKSTSKFSWSNFKKEKKK